MSYATMSNTSVAEGTVFKISLERRGGVELRRVRGVFSFEEICSVIRHMWNSDPKRINIEYEDEDGDRIRVGSELEWSEAIHHHADRGDRVVRLFAKRGTKAGDRARTSDSSSDGETVETTAQAEAIPKAVVPPLPLHDNSSPQQKSDEPTSEIPADEGMSRQGTEGTADHENTIDLLSRLFDCDAAKEIQDMFSKVNFSPIVSRRVDAVAQEVHVDVDKVALRHFTVTRTNLWIGNALYEKAESTLEAAMRVWPDDHIFEYNAACSASLRGDLEKAMSLLEQAVEHGYRNVQQLKRDPDLENVRGHPNFGRIIEASRGTHVEVVEHNDDTETSGAAKVDAPVTDVDRFLAVFPHMTSEEAERVLKRFDGNLPLAVNHCLTAM
eukprot:CAMPEP_0174851806 /NCGR_PEP_ID=MMETSP1114-20130205/23984_1 /TAXON_ID=312471 /ORGANISM="Neobodo designis, Strain CCAP 1951/1" /LENGTH=382 /DNA_ID=CAMNT_0016086363 /DNA_START=51 /DNA_END=1199 /DNA_ORIENTATION=+